MSQTIITQNVMLSFR